MQIEKHRLRVMIFLVLPLLQSCGLLGLVFPDRQAEYLTAPVAPPLQVPGGLDNFTLVEMFPVPENIARDGAYYETPPPPKGLDSRVREGVVIQSFTGRRWILIGATPGQVWPRIRDFWATAQVNLDREDAVRGIMETQWVEIEQEDSRQKYILRIEPGLHPGNSEVYLVNVDEAELTPGFLPTTVETSHNPEAEELMLNALSVYLADRTDLYRASSVSLLAGSIEMQSKSRLVRDQAGKLILELDIDYERAWSQVGQSLSTARLDIIESLRSEGHFKVTFAGREEEVDEPGFLARFFRRGDENAAQDLVFTVQLEETDSTIRVSTSAAGNLPIDMAQRLGAELIQVISENLS
ncbi:MAG: outer membrane protein assembly factor BamC [Pseudomonadales bacterium]|nr:outer membrane protein assembly factor BamC [Pseudomonadales bacterium]